MSDLYSVLKQSILDRRLRSKAARKDVYAQARTAVVRQLWTYDPPLGESEIEDRIGEFDHAVEIIEADVAQIFAEARAPAPQRPATRQLPAPTNLPVLEGYDEEADYTPAIAARRGQPPEKTSGDRGQRTAGRQEIARRRPSVAEIEKALAQSGLNEGRTYDLRPDNREPDDQEAEAYPAQSEASPDDPYDDRERRWLSETNEERYESAADSVGSEPAYEEDAYDEGDPSEDRYEEDAAPQLRRWWTWRELSEKHRILVLLSAIGGLVVILIVLGAVLFFGSGGATNVSPTTATGANTPATVPPPPRPASEDGSAVVQSFVVFDGRDPTVFQTGPANPIRFAGANTGGYARISSSASDSGVRVVIGPGLADRLAGQSIRITVSARSAHENGAVGLRFAYQSGVALSPWQTENLQPDFVAQTLTWRVPKQRTDPDGDYILIEPGIPGDGTGADINSIRIDLLG